MTKNGWKYLIGIASLSLLSACSLFNINENYSYTLTAQDTAMIDTLFNQTQPYCLGRYTFQYPQALADKISSTIIIDGMTITSKPIFPPAFKQRLELRETELKNEPVSDTSNAPFLKQVIKLNNGIIFDHNRDYNKPDSARILEAYVYIDNVFFLITTEFIDITDKKYKEEQDIFIENNWKLTKKQEKLATMQSLITHLQGRPDNAIPTTKGVCIPYGFILDDGDKHLEEISILFENSQFYWAVVMDNTIASEKESLLERADEIKSVLYQYGGKTLRKGPIAYNHVLGEEWLVLGRDKRYDNLSDKFYYFQYYTNEKNITYYTPSVSILMHSTNKVVNYTDEQMVEIWDQILQTFKYR
ncbi:T6SS immunity protein Tli4 family protein [Proteus mirabilis]|uniref:T6SS immunity protein Tli4 family protein n=1 Tax=Proteus mirabilis TaxID=584 RepID=UPI0023615E71|nr:T6SS immunity protein Tli4 family protein [Proteus mirabilis]MDC9769038.1 T6SS immunity protein Tli4 family protein [Proteus mirabilis]